MTESPAKSKKQIQVPAPLKIVAGLSLILIVGGYCLGLSLIYLARDLGRKITDPAYMTLAIKQAGLQDPGADYKKVVGLQHEKTGYICLERVSDGALFVMLGKPLAEDEDVVPLADVVSKYYEFGFLNPKSNLFFQAITKKDKRKVKGKELSYFEADLKDVNNSLYHGAIGCIREGKRLLLIEAAQPADKPFEMQSVDSLLERALP
jgi:hypothetical protein